MAITFVTSPALLLYHPILHDHNYILGAGHDTRIEFAAFLEVLQAIAQIGVAVVMFPTPAQQREPRAWLRRIADRRIDDRVRWPDQPPIAPDVASGSGGVGWRQQRLAGDCRSTLVEIHKWTFLVGPGFCVAVNDVILGYLMYTTGLIPRRLAMFGLIGGPLIFASSTAVVFGAYTQTGSVAGIVTIPVFIFEAGFAIYLIVKGFRPSHVLSGEPAT